MVAQVLHQSLRSSISLCHMMIGNTISTIMKRRISSSLSNSRSKIRKNKKGSRFINRRSKRVKMRKKPRSSRRKLPNSKMMKLKSLCWSCPRSSTELSLILWLNQSHVRSLFKENRISQKQRKMRPQSFATSQLFRNNPSM